MRAVWDSRAFDATDRSEALRETIREQVVDVELDLPTDPERVEAIVGLGRFGSMQSCSVDAMPTVVTRSRRKARADGEPSLFVTVQVRETSVMVQHGREAMLRPGQLAVYATTAPYTLVFAEGVHAHFLRFPIAELALPLDVLDAASARPLGLGDPVADLTWRFLRDLAVTPMSDREARVLGTPARELLRAALTGLVGGGEHRSAMAQTLPVRVEQYLRDHHADPDLSADQVAAAHHVSVRTLFAALSGAGVRFSDLLRTHRLERCRAELGDPRRAPVPIAAVARQHGFVNASHFSRQFREEFGVTPSQWREICSRGTAVRAEGAGRPERAN